jgi:hypothetical protein
MGGVGEKIKSRLAPPAQIPAGRNARWSQQWEKKKADYFQTSISCGDGRK